MSKPTVEEFRDIKGYEGLYQVSNLGRVISLVRVTTVDERYRSYTRTIGGKEVKAKKDNCGYMYIGLYKDGERKIFKVHRLVADTFIPNPQNKMYVNHIDEDKENNCASNLSWVDFKENIDYSQSRIVARISEVGKIEKVYNSINEVKADGYVPSSVVHILNKTRKIKTHKGKRWVEIPKEIEKWQSVF